LIAIGPEAEEQGHSEHNSTTRLTDGLEVQNNDGSQEVQWSPHFVQKNSRLEAPGTATVTYL
jgi:hypothetical protein